MSVLNLSKVTALELGRALVPGAHFCKPSQLLLQSLLLKLNIEETFNKLQGGIHLHDMLFWMLPKVNEHSSKAFKLTEPFAT
jgi:hypothetical protein